MHAHLSFNQQIKAVSEANLNAVSSASLYGRGVFTTVAIYKSKPFQWRIHWERLTQNASKISLDVSELNESLLQKSFDELIAANTIKNGRARITIFDSRFGAIWNFESEKKIDVLITTADFGQPKEMLNLTSSAFSVNTESPLTNIKSCNYLENLLALEDAKRRGFDEALRLNQRGEIVSAAMANVFWVKNEAAFTPSLKTGALNGTTRNFVLSLAEELNLKVFEVENSIDNLLNADEIFLTSVGLKIVPVSNFENRAFGKTFAQKLIDAYDAKTSA